MTNSTVFQCRQLHPVCGAALRLPIAEPASDALALFDYLGRIAPSRHLAWDCGTGNGQAAVGLASLFDRLIATDASEKQIANTQPHERVEYRITPAENSGIDSGTIDLIMVAQALHWFDLNRFYAEARRVLKSNGVLAASAHSLLRIKPAIDKIVNRYYHEVVGPFWPPERKLVENLADLRSPFHEIGPPKIKRPRSGTSII